MGHVPKQRFTAKPPTIQQLVDIVREYNTARGHELSQKPPGGWPPDYENPMMETLYDCALMAAAQLKPALSVDLTIADLGGRPKPK